MFINITNNTSGYRLAKNMKKELLEHDLCSFKRLAFAVEPEYLGNAVGTYPGSVDDCIERCKQTKECRNFVYCRNKNECYLKDGILTGSEPDRGWDQQFSVYKSCLAGMFRIIIFS